MPVKIEHTGQVLTAYLSGELDHHSAKEMREQIDSAVEINMPTLLILNFADVTFMDSSGIGLVMGRYRNFSKREGTNNYSIPFIATVEFCKGRLVKTNTPQSLP